MAYRLSKDDETLTDTLRRIAREELSSALSQLPAHGTAAPKGVHDIRKRVKKLRGLLRLVRPGFETFAVENAALRETAQGLSALRDATVRLATFDRLFPEPPETLSQLRAHLAAEAAAPTALAASVDQTRAALATILARAEQWTLQGKDRRILSTGLARTRTRARAALALAARDPGMEAMHEWRKRAKDHWYQARLLTPIWPEVMTPIATALSDLTEDLGNHHDLFVLADHVAALPGDDPAAQGAALVSLHAMVARQDIEDRAFPEGARLFAGAPREMADLWVRWWKIWRD